MMHTTAEDYREAEALRDAALGRLQDIDYAHTDQAAISSARDDLNMAQSLLASISVRLHPSSRRALVREGRWWLGIGDPSPAPPRGRQR